MKLPQYEKDTLAIDVLIFWSGNELTGCLDPSFNEDDYTWHGQVDSRRLAGWNAKDFAHRQGSFPDIAKRVSRCIDKLSSLRDKPHVGFVALNGNVRHDLFSMPEQYNEVMDLFGKYARQGNLLTATLTSFTTNSIGKLTATEMRRLVKYVVELTTQMRAEQVAALMGMPALNDLANRFPWVEHGYYKRSYESYFQLALEEAMQKRRFMPVELKEVPAEPWEPDAAERMTTP